jgi:hypothetical protein
MWQVVYLDPVADWLLGLDDAAYEQFVACVELLQEHGPHLGRPLVDSIGHSEIGNLKELRAVSPGATEIRALFVFDPQRQAVFVVIGDKRNKWKSWYAEALPLAEARYTAYLREGNHS